MASNDLWRPPPRSDGQTSDDMRASDFLDDSMPNGSIITDGNADQHERGPKARSTTAPDHGHSSDTANAVATNASANLSVRNAALDDSSGELRMVLIGKTGNGKSAVGNTLIGENVFVSKGSPKSVTKECKIKQTERFGKTLVVVDTPGFLDTNMKPEELLEHFVSCSCFTCPGIHAILLVLSVGHRYLDVDKKAIESMKELFCQKCVDHTVVVFTGKETLDNDRQNVVDYMTDLPDYLQLLIKTCKGGVVAISNIGDGREEAARRVINKVEDLVRKNGGESQYYTTALSVAISDMVAENMREILNGNAEGQEQIRMLKQEMERLFGDDPRVLARREEIERIIGDERQRQIEIAREEARENARRIWTSRIKKAASMAFGVLTLIALLLKK